MNQSKPIMTIQESIKVCLRKYVDFSGRATRAEFWWWVLATTVVGIVLGVADSWIDVLADRSSFTLFGIIFALVVLLPHLAVSARRLHDIGKTGWWQLLWAILAWGVWIVFLPTLGRTLVNSIFGEGWNVPEDQFRATLTFARFGPAIIGLMFTLLVTLAVVVWGFVWMTREGEAGPNLYGPAPR